jgi:hypothetical protein
MTGDTGEREGVSGILRETDDENLLSKGGMYFVVEQ